MDNNIVTNWEDLSDAEKAFLEDPKLHAMLMLISKSTKTN